MDEKKFHLFFDDQCSLCNRFQQALNHISMSEQIIMKPLSDPETFRQFPDLIDRPYQDFVQLLDADGNWYSGGDAINELVKLWPVIGKFSWLLEKGMGKKAVDFFYHTVSQYRKNMLKECCGQHAHKK